MTDDASRYGRSHESAVRRIWRTYRFEIMLLVLAAVGLLLIFERSAVRLALERIVRWLGLTLLRGADRLLALLGRVSPSDIVGLTLVLVALAVIVWRIRWRVMHSPRLTTVACPSCGGVIHRVRRKAPDRALNVVVPVKRYRCASRECGWQGLRVAAPKGAAQPMATKATQHS